MSDQRTCRATGRLSCECASQHLSEKRLTRCWYDQRIRGIQKVQERPSDCALGASRMRQHEWVKKERWVGMDFGRRDLTGLSAGLDGSTSIRGDVGSAGPSKSSPFPPPKKSQPSPAPSSFTFLTNCGDCRGTLIRFRNRAQTSGR